MSDMKKIEEYFIEIKNGKPYGYPIHMDNFLLCYPEEDVNNLSERFSKFIRHDLYQHYVDNPHLRPKFYQTHEETYVQNGDAWEDLWIFRDLTDEEVQERIDTHMPMANVFVNNLITQTEYSISSMTDEIEIKVWNNYLNRLKNYVITDPDPMVYKTNLPWPPRLQDGVWYPLEYTE